MDDIIIDDTLFRLMLDAVRDAGYEANILQSVIDRFVAVQGAGLSESEILALAQEGSSVIAAEIQSFLTYAEKYYNTIINRGAQEGVMAYQQEFGESDLWVWFNPAAQCPDCIDRTSWEPAPYAWWEAVGLPKSGATICGYHCLCIMAPADEA